MGCLSGREWLGAWHGGFYKELSPGQLLGKIKIVFSDQVHFFFLQLAEEEPNKWLSLLQPRGDCGSREASCWCLGRKLTPWLCCFTPVRITHLGYRGNWIYYMIKFSTVLFSKKHLSPLSINMVLKCRYDKYHYTCVFQCFSGDPNLWFSNRTWYICRMILMIGKKRSRHFHLSLPILMALTGSGSKGSGRQGEYSAIYGKSICIALVTEEKTQ